MMYYATTALNTILVVTKVWLNTMIYTALTLYIFIINHEGLGYLPFPKAINVNDSSPHPAPPRPMLYIAVCALAFYLSSFCSP
jgi:hypothetical protein